MDDFELSRGWMAGIIAAVVAVIASIFWFATASWASVPPDKIMLHYTGGPIQGTHFRSLVQPGTGTKFYGMDENLYFLPATQRTYTFSKDPNVGDKAGVDFISAPSSDNVLFTFESTTYFKLNTDPKVIRTFFEQICLHDHCWDLSKNGGWDQMLEQYFRPQVEQTLRLEVGKYDRVHLYSDPQTLLTINKSVGTELQDRINAAVGGEYFCGPDSGPSQCNDFGFVVKNPTPPDAVVQEYANTAAAQQAVITSQQQAAAKAAAAKGDAESNVTRAQGDADAARARAGAPALTPEQLAYLQAQAALACAQSSSCTLIINGSNGGVNVNTGPTK